MFLPNHTDRVIKSGEFEKKKTTKKALLHVYHNMLMHVKVLFITEY